MTDKLLKDLMNKAPITAKDLGIPEDVFKAACETDMNELNWKEPEIEELDLSDEAIEEYTKEREKTVETRKRWKCRICFTVYPKSYKQISICTNCHTKHSLELVEIDVMEIKRLEGEID